jgi:hypothetical protein
MNDAQVRAAGATLGKMLGSAFKSNPEALQRRVLTAATRLVMRSWYEAMAPAVTKAVTEQIIAEEFRFDISKAELAPSAAITAQGPGLVISATAIQKAQQAAANAFVAKNRQRVREIVDSYLRAEWADFEDSYAYKQITAAAASDLIKAASEDLTAIESAPDMVTLPAITIDVPLGRSVPLPPTPINLTVQPQINIDLPPVNAPDVNVTVQPEPRPRRRGVKMERDSTGQVVGATFINDDDPQPLSPLEAYERSTGQ